MSDADPYVTAQQLTPQPKVIRSGEAPEEDEVEEAEFDKLMSAPPPPTPPLCKTLATAVVPVYFVKPILSNSARTKAVTQLAPLAC